MARDPYAYRREDMVRRQIEARGVHDSRVLDAMRRVPRHELVPAEQRDAAYQAVRSRSATARPSPSPTSWP